MSVNTKVPTFVFAMHTTSCSSAEEFDDVSAEKDFSELCEHQWLCTAANDKNGSNDSDDIDDEHSSDSEGDAAYSDAYSEQRHRPMSASHPFLDIEAQRVMLDYEKQQRQSEFVCRMNMETMLHGDSQELAVKLLMNEAHRQHRARIAKKQSPLEKDDCDLLWLRLAKPVLRDFHLEGHAFVQRKMSCMCMFNPLTDDRIYGDSDNDRVERLARQSRVLQTLRAQAKTGGSAYFLQKPKL